MQDEMELLDVLIEKWDDEHSKLREDVDPITLLKYIMDEHKMQPKHLAELLGVGKSLVSEILHYKKGLSKDAIRILAERFKLRQEALNRPYELKGTRMATAEGKVGKPVTASSKPAIGASAVKTKPARTAHR